ncbi:MAG: HD domain-containing protein [Lachnospiraceae bacterium]|nr:HD domain-containing protein [Lachnospiraceae bacterium]MDD3615604.1 HD domain-containing protein [Lachnospiraceae bacterium]
MDTRGHVEQAFDSYTAAYDLSDAKIQLKYIHTKKVAENAARIARSLKLSGDDCELNWEIGMLHDIGRFEQLKRYDTFMDSESIDHAEFGADLLFKEGLIEWFEPDTSKYELMEMAIRCHNRYEIPVNLNNREKLFAQVIRDADKIDIFRANYETGMENIYNVTSEELKQASVTPAVYEAFLEGHTVLRSLKKTPVDHLIGHLSLFFGLVYPESQMMVMEQGYMWKLACFKSDNSSTIEILENIRNILFYK